MSFSLLTDKYNKSALLVGFFFLCLSVTYIFLYSEGFHWLFHQWSSDDAYSHGFFIPFISLYLIWRQKERFTRLQIKPDYTTSPILIGCCLFLLVAARSSAVIQLEALSLFLFIPGLLLLLFGRQITRAALFPWLYLNFMIPWVDVLLERLYYPFQVFSAVIGTTLLKTIYPVFRSGITIHLPDLSMIVVEACSGINFLMSILGIGLPLVYLTQRSWPRATLIIISGIVITILTNGLRVGLAGIMGQRFGVDMLHGPGHIFQGWFVAWVGWFFLFLINWLVSKTTSKDQQILANRWKLHQKNPGAHLSPQLVIKKSGLGIVIIAVCITATFLLTPKPIPLAEQLDSLPMRMFTWKGREAVSPFQKSFFPQTDSTLHRRYYSPTKNTSIYLFIGYINKQTEQKRLVSIHSRPLHKGAEKIKAIIKIPSQTDRPMMINKGVFTANNVQYDLFFWYQFPEKKVVTDRNQARVTALKNGILSKKNNGAVVLIATPHLPTTNLKQDHLPGHVDSFLNTFLPFISQLLP